MTGERPIVAITGLDHVQLAMPAGQEDVALKFYAEVLEMEELAKPPHLLARGGCWFRSGTAVVHLGVEAGFHAARKAHPALVVTDLEAFRRTLAAAGHVCTDDEPLAGQRRTYVSDPFGNRIELTQPVPT